MLLAATEVKRAAGAQTPWSAALVTAARDPRLTYANRVGAAHAMGETGTTADNLGSDELAVIAQAPAPNPQEAEKPGYVAARLLAARAATDNAVRVRLLTGALALRPEDAQARLEAFEAAYAAGEHQKAVALLEPLLESTSFAYSLGQTASVFDEQAPEHYVDDYMVRQFLSGYAPPERMPELAAKLGESLASIGRLSAAALVDEVSLRIEPNAQVSERVEALQGDLERRAENARRRPAIQDDLAQPYPVHPKLEPRP
ncbi:MAG: hypothetical protein R2748_26475 [Bryobacterales bacterium]